MKMIHVPESLAISPTKHWKDHHHTRGQTNNSPEIGDLTELLLLINGEEVERKRALGL